jgi:hypothetical protein
MGCCSAGCSNSGGLYSSYRRSGGFLSPFDEVRRLQEDLTDWASLSHFRFSLTLSSWLLLSVWFTGMMAKVSMCSQHTHPATSAHTQLHLRPTHTVQVRAFSAAAKRGEIQCGCTHRTGARRRAPPRALGIGRASKLETESRQLSKTHQIFKTCEFWKPETCFRSRKFRLSSVENQFLARAVLVAWEL